MQSQRLTTAEWLAEFRDEAKEFVRDAIARGKDQIGIEPGVRMLLRAAEYALCGAVDEAYSKLVNHLSQEIPMTPYPTSLDIPTYLADAMAFFRGQGDKNVLIRDSWEAAGFGLGKFFPVTGGATPPGLVAQAAVPSLAGMSDDQIANLIEQQITTSQGVTAFDWNALLAFVMEIAKRILDKYLGN